MKKFLLALFFLFSSLPLMAANYYVTKWGNDSTGSGTRSNPWATPGKAAGSAVAGDVVFIETGTYTLTTNVANVAGGVINMSVGEDSTPVTFCGYSVNPSTFNTDTQFPIIDVGAQTNLSVFKIDNYSGAARFINITVDGNDNTGIVGFDLASTGGSAVRCKALDCPTGFRYGMTLNCEANSCGTYGFYKNVFTWGSNAIGCEIGFYGDNNGRYMHCLAKDSVSHGFFFLQGDAGASQAANCTAYNNGGSGFYVSSYNRSMFLINNLSYGNSAYGFLMASNSGNGNTMLYKCAAGSNTSGNSSGFVTDMSNVGFVTLTANPFTNTAGNDFSLNNTAGGGAALRAAGFPGTFFDGLSTTGYLDIGAVQHQDSGGTSATVMTISVGGL